MKEFYIDNEGIRLHAKLDRPKGADRSPLCIVFHGFTGHMEERHIVAAARAMNEVGVATLRVELYGHGQSDGAFANHTLYKWVNNALHIIDYAKGLDWVSELYAAGHSQGGLLTMLVAGMRPDDLAAIIPMSAAYNIPDAARTGDMFGFDFDPDHIPDQLDNGSVTLGGDYFRVAQTLHPEEQFDRYAGPVLLVHGDQDVGVPASLSIEAAQRYANARLVLLEGDEHCYPRCLDQVCEAIKEFLGELQQ